MIFFTIEFPPVVYATQQCKYKFTFDAKKELVEYKFIENQDKKECNKLELGPFENKEFDSSFFPSHAAFFESNKLNGTKKLIDDPVIVNRIRKLATYLPPKVPVNVYGAYVRRTIGT